MADEASVKAAILAAASENSFLLVKLSSTREAPGLLASHEKRAAALRDALLEQTEILEALKQDVDSKFRRHKRFRDSMAKRFVYCASNMAAKFEAKAVEEEREYFALLNAQSKAETRRLALQKDYEEAVKEQRSLEAAAQEHAETHAAVDALYDKLFSGPTPGFPEEDEKENRFHVARENTEAVKEAIRGARRARKILAVSQACIDRAQCRFQNADQKAVDSMFFMGDALSSLRQGNDYVNQAINSIRRIEENLAPPFLEIVAVKVEVDAYLAAAKTVLDAAFGRKKIASIAASSQKNLVKAKEALQKLAALIVQKEESSLGDLRETARRLEDSRQELEQFRKGIFEKVAGFGEAAPAYTECCDRMEIFSEVLEGTQQDDHRDGNGDVPAAKRVGENTSVTTGDEIADATSQSSEPIPLIRKQD
jgi:hypothetical protein